MEAKIAYFSAEFGIDSSLPIYSGGLGVLAGDHVKAANDLNIPLVGVGIFYRKGYFQQRILADGRQEAIYPTLNVDQIPVEPVLNQDGTPLLIEVPIADRSVFLKAWVTKVGNVSVYLLDANHDQNSDWDRSLTDSLYGGDQHTRISQEMILGIGGVRLLHELNIYPDVWHMNEGHSAFLTLERIRYYSANGISFETALEAVKASTVFTTHTPVPAGHDHFSFEMMDQYFGPYYWQLGTSRENILKLGEIDNRFNMTRLAVSTSSKVNGVSKLHAKVTRRLFHQWNPEIPPQHIPVEAVTNGIHTQTWLAPEMKELFDRYLDSTWERKIAEMKTWEKVWEIPSDTLWETHQKVKKRMIDALGLPIGEETLIIGFARRFATYKRALLLFRDLERLERIMNQEGRPVAVLLAGKAHPADHPGQELIRQVWEISQRPAFKNKIFFLENYDMDMAKHLVAGVDVWLNTPTKPMEASGTSGQKAAVNGVINCSVMDGWWNEGYNGKNGWAIQGHEQGTREEQDGVDSEALYTILEQEMVPLYFDQRNDWITMMKECISSLSPVFSTCCMVKEYWGKLYIPTAIRGRRFIENDMEVASRVASYKQFIGSHWDGVYIQDIQLIPSRPQIQTIQCKVRLGNIWHRDVSVEAVGSLGGERGLWKRGLQMVKELEPGFYLYQGAFTGSMEDWAQYHANIRVMPVSPDFANDYETELVKWG